MKKRSILVISLILIASVILSACGSTEPTDENVTINMPIVDVGSKETEESPNTQTEPAEVVDTYPINEAPAVPDDSPMNTYPIDSSALDYDEQMEAYVLELLDGKHELQFLFDQDLSAEQWREILMNSNHNHIVLSEGELTAVIEWLISK